MKNIEKLKMLYSAMDYELEKAQDPDRMDLLETLMDEVIQLTTRGNVSAAEVADIERRFKEGL